MPARKTTPQAVKPPGVRKEQVLTLLAIHPECLSARHVADAIRLSMGRTTELLRELRKAGHVLPTCNGLPAKWGLTKHAERIRSELASSAAEALRIAEVARAKDAKRKADEEAADRWIEAWATAPAYRLTSANDAPRIQRSKPYSVFTLAAPAWPGDLEQVA